LGITWPAAMLSVKIIFITQIAVLRGKGLHNNFFLFATTAAEGMRCACSPGTDGNALEPTHVVETGQVVKTGRVVETGDAVETGHVVEKRHVVETGMLLRQGMLLRKGMLLRQACC